MEKDPVVGSYLRLLEMSQDPNFNRAVRQASERSMRTLWRFMQPGEKKEALRRKDLLNGEQPDRPKPRIWIG